MPGKAPKFYAAKVSFRVPRRNTELCEEKQKSNFLANLFCLPHCLCDYKLKSKISTKSREHYNPTIRLISDNKGSGYYKMSCALSVVCL